MTTAPHTTANPITFPPDPEGEKRPPRCARCHYPLVGLTEPRCPECGQAFDAQSPWTYTRRVKYIRWWFWMPALALATGAAVFWAIGFYLAGHLGWGVFLGVPFMVGLLIWYRLPVRQSYLFLYSSSAVLAVVCVLFCLGYVGMFCGLLLLPIYLGSAYAALVVGFIFAAVLKSRLKRSSFSQRDYLGTLLILLLPGFLHLAELKTTPAPAIETVHTTMILEAPPARAWQAWMFYEEVEHAPPMLLRLGLPRPIGVRHKIQAPGDIEVCLYDRGRLVKRATRVEPGQTLAFEVIDQVNIEDRSIRLIDGRFDFTPVGRRHTQVQLTTRYEPMLTPRFLWRPIEHRFTHALHRHVLEGMHDKVCIPVAERAQETGGEG